MKKYVVILLSTMVAVLYAASAGAQCNGLKNPINFTYYNNPVTGQYTGKTGTKPYTASNCNTGTVGMNFTTDVTNAQLATETSSMGSSYCGSSLYNDKRFAIMSKNEGPGTGSNLGKDPLTNYGLPYVPNFDSSFLKSIRIGQCRTSAEAEALYYTMQVSPQNALVFINYAIVAQAPGHGVTGDPEFVIRVMHQNSSGQWVQISDTLCYVVSTTPTSNGGTVTIGQNGWHSVSGSGGTIYYKDWAQVAINLYNYLYQSVRIEVMTGDCAAHGHYAYAYIAGDCQAMSLIANGCAAGDGNQIADIHAPKGLSGYQWYRSLNGALNGDAINVNSNYAIIEGATDSILDVMVEHMIKSNGDTATQSTFKCVMTSYMDPAKPVPSTLFTNVGNMKPAISIDSLPLCDGSVFLTNTSRTPFTMSESDQVDTSATVWEFFNTSTPGLIPVYTATGGTASYTYAEPGTHCVRVRTSAFDTTCWNRKTIQIRSLSPTAPVIQPERNNLCAGDTILIFDRTPGTVYRKWHIYNDHGLDTTWEGSAQQAIQFRFDWTSTVEVTSHPNVYYLQDTNLDGVQERIYCDATADTIIYVEQYPQLVVTGDTIVCMGSLAEVSVNSDIANCTYEWSHTLGGGAFQTTQTMSEYPQTDVMYYVKVTSPNGCVTWDSLGIFIVDPVLTAPITELCPGDPTTLSATNAAYFTWSASPNDPSLAGQENNDSITVTPSQTTVYTLTGHGSNGCDATPLTQTITVYPYPEMSFEMNPTFFDSEEPIINFRNTSTNTVSTLWDFGNGETYTTPQVTYTCTDITQDSILIKLSSYNALHCESDTQFYVPIKLFSIWFPNVITPTLSTNRTFKPFTGNELEYYSLYIYNRAGQLMWASHDQNAEWDGKYKDKYCDQGSYVYVCTYRRPGTVDVVTQKGTFLILN